MRLGVVLSHRLHARNMLASSFLDRMSRRGHDLVLYVPDALRGAVAPLMPPRCALESLDPWIGGPVRRRLRESLRLASLAARARTGSPTYRHKVGQRRPLPARAQLRGWQALGLVADPERLAQGIEAMLPVRQNLPAGQIDALLLPTLCHEDNAQSDIMKAVRRSGIPILALPASWDNLTTKGCFMVQPDEVGVWGPESAAHAVQHHGFWSSEVAVVGPPHFWPYVSDPWDPLTPSDTVFYAGTSIAYAPDEQGTLLGLDSALRSAGVSAPIWYRPHPRRSDVDAGALPSTVVLDTRWAECKEWSLDPYDLVFLKRRLCESSCVVTAFSTLIIEAALCGRPSVVLGFGRATDGGGLAEHRAYTHMQNVLRQHGVTVATDPLSLLLAVRTAIQGPQRWHGGALREWALRIADVKQDPRERIADWIEASVC